MFRRFLRTQDLIPTDLKFWKVNLYPFQIFYLGRWCNQQTSLIFFVKDGLKLGQFTKNKSFFPKTPESYGFPKRELLLRSELDLRSPRMGEAFGAMISFPTNKNPQISETPKDFYGDRLRHFPRFGSYIEKSGFPPFFPKILPVSGDFISQSEETEVKRLGLCVI